MKGLTISRLSMLTVTVGMALSVSGCGKHPEPGHAAHAHPAASHRHEHEAPHGGTAVMLGTEVLLFKPVANPATGETESDTSLYEVSADWLKKTPAFDGIIPLITVRGQEFRTVKFNFPLGNETR